MTGLCLAQPRGATDQGPRRELGGGINCNCTGLYAILLGVGPDTGLHRQVSQSLLVAGGLCIAIALFREVEDHQRVRH